MPKRGRLADQLTGGSHDVNPQYTTGRVTMTGGGTTTTVGFPLNLTRTPSTHTKIPIVEALRLFVSDDNAGAIANAAETELAVFCALTTYDPAGANVVFEDPRCLARIVWRRVGAFTPGGTYYGNWEEQKEVDLSDGAGHGILVGTDNIYFQVGATAGVTATAAFKLMYRIKYVSLSEYVQMVASQQ